MKLSKNLCYGLGVASVIALPVASVISCGETAQNPKPKNPENNSPQTNNPQPSVPPVAVSSKYSTSTFLKEAQALNDNARWKGGIAFQSVLAITSLVRALSEKYGYSSQNASAVLPSEKKSQREKDLESGGIFIDSENNMIGTPSPDQLKVIKVLQTLKQPLQKTGDEAQYSAVGEYGPFSLSRLNWLNITTDYDLTEDSNKPNEIKVNTKGESGVADKLYFDWYSMYDDTENQGFTKILLHERNSKVTYEFKIQGLQDKYAKYDNAQFDFLIMPTVKETLQKFIEIYTKYRSIIILASNWIKDSSFFDQVNYLVSKIAINGTFRIDQNFDKYIHELSQGGFIHWMAVKAFYFGFDASMARGFMAPFSVIDNYWDYGEGLDGLKDANHLQNLGRWAHHNSFWYKKEHYPTAPASVKDWRNFSYPTKNYIRMALDGTKTLDQNLRDGDYTQEDIDMLKTYTDFLDTKPQRVN